LDCYTHTNFSFMDNKYTNQAKNKTIFPVLFIGHGNPMNALVENEFSLGWKSSVSDLSSPVAIICISAHWETRGTLITAMERPKTIHDFYGFPKPLYDVEYPAQGSPGLASEFINSIIPSIAAKDYNWGLDHGCWSVLKHMYPKADIPVIQISLDRSKSAREHFEFAKQLRPYREKGVLIVASGNIVHNLSLVDFQMNTGFDWAIEANETIKSNIVNFDVKPLIEFEKQGRVFNLAIPTAEHYLPLLYALALKNENDTIGIFNDKTEYGSLSMTSLRIGN
jgi:4,5-DOPA dioxygenase extradiol